MNFMQTSALVDDLTAPEVRVLGCLIEKEATTPDSYPLTLNSIRNACNQTTSRDPVVSYDDHDVEGALESLRERGLTRTVHSTSNRAVKFRQVLAESLDMDPASTALLSVLLLRGPQTVGELKGRADRQYEFGSIDEVASVLGALAERPEPLVVRLDRQPGQKDARWIHLLGETDVDSSAVSDAGVATSDAYGEATAEFYDLLATGMWDNLGLELLDLLADVDPNKGSLIDLGSGTGIGLPYLAAAVPDAELFAIEPSKAMRTALHARLTADDKLRVSTTVSPTTFAEARLPTHACALVASAALGHLNDSERSKLWSYIAERMPVGAPAVIGVLAPDRSLEVPLVCYRQLDVGNYVYEGWQSGEPLDDRTMLWTLTYKVLDGDDLIAEYTASARWRCDGVDDVRAEIEPYGLSLEAHADYVVVRRCS
jgi:uncharacterized protein YceH (UPF0502 family)